MSMDIKAPAFPESISEGTVAGWLKAVGASVRRDEVLVEIETDKVVLEVVAPDDGVLTEILAGDGETVASEQVIGRFESVAAGAPASSASAAPAPAPSAESPASASPAARKLADEQGIDIRRVAGSGRDGRITKEDVARAAAAPAPAAGLTTGAVPRQPEAARGDSVRVPAAPAQDTLDVGDAFRGERVERRVPMTRLRASIARRLVEAQQTAAMLTTFNEVDMSAVMALRKKYQDAFQARHNGTRLGFMSFFVRASVEALKRFPAVNASLDGNDIVYHGYYDIGVAVSTERGLVVPVVRDADALGLSQIEDQINDFGRRAREGKLTIEDMTGGTFTISNGGIFGSLLSTPILNPPQTGILGMHKIQDRPVAVDGQVVIRPMMYLALSYDHRLIDGQEAVRFLVAIKEMLEDPARILLEL
ncbi:MAG: 2-oxoglutarate dehydrogenase complex dihydrolipoyllysine-residue succinyltransferase [Pseudomonadales bacterium]|nr:2-oxoglutarate dehydrogenase complex dihydrolipoyllysine-residue succinyltransferase [Pseudomonadales bacterium]